MLDPAVPADPAGGAPHPDLVVRAEAPVQAVPEAAEEMILIELTSGRRQ